MMTIGILTILVFGMSAIVVDGAKCLNSKDSERYVVVNCAYQEFLFVPTTDVLKDVETLNLEHNYIGKLFNNSFTEYPNIKNLMLSFNKVHTIEPGALGSLGELEMLDLSQNAIKEVPAGLPKSLTQLRLNGNPVSDMRQLETAVGLRVLQLRGCDLRTYPELGIMPNLVSLDVSENGDIVDLDPAQLAITCRLARLNVTGATNLFRPGTPGAHCRCRRVVQWANTYKITVFGLGHCPDPLAGDGELDIHDDPNSEACARIPEQALAAFKECMAEWEHRNTPYWAIASGVVIAVAVLLALCVCMRRRRRRGRRGNANKVQSAQSPPPSDAKVAHNDSAGNNKTEPAALLSSAA
ncbi:PREDICTED: immunoglobulin superfamily containing leucine-rich repeat protein 2-like [Diuraphis noxia]|uniref:immunoglobulin superfamily containing leucine-rich repeat protein 2-like n=1 Tax=Diuraphis noxia TaxID=143948 RepID=UPI000763800C|nr:PREDICTED: immunoglobulin superfamily containing leucine-rich repeat protein 2-like [Diuraphis noxia]